MSRSPRIIAAILIGWLALSVHSLSAQNFDADLHPQKLPDGATLQLIQVDYARSNIFLAQSFFQNAAKHLGQPAGVNVSGLQVLPPLAKPFSVDFPWLPTNRLVFFTKYDSPLDPAVASSNLVKLMENTRIVLLDESGRQYDHGLLESGDLFRLGPGASVLAWPVPIFSRTGKSIVFRMVQQTTTNQWHSIAEFTAPNPARFARPLLRAQPFPQRISTNGFIFALLDLQMGQNTNGLGKAPVTNNARAIFRVEKEGRVTDMLMPVAVILSDTGGNTRRSDLVRVPSAGTDMVFEFRSPLHPDDPWRLQVEFARQKDFSKGQLFTNIQAGFTYEGPLSFQIPGGRAAVDLRQTRRAKTPAGSSAAAILLHEATPGVRVDLVALDPLPAITNLSFPVHLRPHVNGPLDDRTIAINYDNPFTKIVLAVQKSHTVEFIAQPRIIPLPNGATRLPALQR